MPVETLRILLAEDDDAHAELLSHSLKKVEHPVEISRVRDGQEAMDRLHELLDDPDGQLPGLILLDVNMPRVNGLDALEAIKTDDRIRHVPTIMLTTSDASADRLRAYDRSANGYLIKPAEYKELRALVTNLVEYWGRWNKPAPRT